MPLTKIENIDHNSSWALWEINESTTELLALCKLSPQDKKSYSEMRHTTKSEELLAGRLATGALAASLGIPYEGLYKDDCDKPYLVNSTCHISISHAHPFAIAVIHRCKPVGIDIEKPQPKLLKVAQKFLNKEERMDAREDLNKLCVYWCAKEALYKIHGRKKLNFKKNLSVEPFVMHDAGNLNCYIILNGVKEAYQLFYEKSGDHYIAYNR